MKRICSWCNMEMSAGVQTKSGTDQVVTHGICEACAAGVLADIETVELHMPEQRPGRVLKPMDSQTKLLDLQRLGISRSICRR
jgi:hypothetical protein